MTFDVSVVGIDASSSASKAVSTEYFDLSGRKVAAPATGLYIQKVTFSDNTVKTKTVMKK